MNNKIFFIHNTVRSAILYNCIIQHLYRLFLQSFITFMISGTILNRPISCPGLLHRKLPPIVMYVDKDTRLYTKVANYHFATPNLLTILNIYVHYCLSVKILCRHFSCTNEYLLSIYRVNYY